MSRNLQAAILSGSGCSSTAAYEIGVMTALLEPGLPYLDGEAFDPSIYSGSGFGGFNAAIMASDVGGGTAATLEVLKRAWLEGLCSDGQRANGVFRVRNPLGLLDPNSYRSDPLKPLVSSLDDTVFLSLDLLARIRANFGPGNSASIAERLMSIPALTPFFDMAPLQTQLRRHVNLEKIRSSSRFLMVNASDWSHGSPCIFANTEMTDPQGYDILQASAAYTLAFPFVEIQGRLFAGGPGTLATPIKPVLETWGGSPLTVHCIYLDPPMADIPSEKMPSALGGLGRWFTQNEAVNIRSDLEYAAGHPPVPPPNGAPTKVKGGGAGRATIHRYRPSKVIVDWFDFADFDRRKTESFIALGYSDARSHDCTASGCTLAN
jgi:predicted acylesterase/phospholipase RssA